MLGEHLDCASHSLVIATFKRAQSPTSLTMIAHILWIENAMVEQEIGAWQMAKSTPVQWILKID